MADDWQIEQGKIPFFLQSFSCPPPSPRLKNNKYRKYNRYNIKLHYARGVTRCQRKMILLSSIVVWYNLPWLGRFSSMLWLLPSFTCSFKEDFSSKLEDLVSKVSKSWVLRYESSKVASDSGEKYNEWKSYKTTFQKWSTHYYRFLPPFDTIILHNKLKITTCLCQ